MGLVDSTGVHSLQLEKSISQDLHIHTLQTITTQYLHTSIRNIYLHDLYILQENYKDFQKAGPF